MSRDAVLAGAQRSDAIPARPEGPGGGAPVAPAATAHRPGIRSDLQGLRGVGIVLVVVGHLWRWPPGVFAMLDMFFVLSGFLITGLLIDAFDKFGRIYFVPFYLSRIRRLLPTAVAVVLATTGLTYLLFTPARASLVAEDGVWALLFAVNWHFARSSTDYFQEQAASPLLHYWSLSVEEQFYAVWPLLLLVLLMLGRRSRLSTRTLLVTGLVVVSLISFAYSLHHSLAAPGVAYYSTVDRIWEFGVGGLLAVGRPWLSRLPLLGRRLLGWGGLVGLIASLFVLQHGFAFPAPWALPAVLLTAAIIASGIGSSVPSIRPLEHGVLVYLGDISYSVYLWHLPINFLTTSFLAPGTTWYFLAALGATAVASVLSYHLLERPLRHAPWLMTRPERRMAKRSLERRAAGMRRVRDGQLAVSAVVTGALVVVALLPAPTDATSQRPTPVAREVAEGLSTLDRHQLQLREALFAPTFPEFDPPLEDLGFQGWIRDLEAHGCVNVNWDDLDGCRFGAAGAAQLAVLVGDSYAISWAPGVRAALEPEGWTLQQLTLGVCGTWTLPSYVGLDGTEFAACARHHELVHEFIVRERPQLIIFASAAANVRHADRKDINGSATTVAARGLGKTLARLPPGSSRVVVLAPPPPHKDLRDCVTRFSTTSDCSSQRSRDWHAHVRGEHLAASDAGVAFVQTEKWFCVGQQCPGFIGATPVTMDGAHLSRSLSLLLAPLLREALLGIRAPDD